MNTFSKKELIDSDTARMKTQKEYKSLNSARAARLRYDNETPEQREKRRKSQREAGVRTRIRNIERKLNFEAETYKEVIKSEYERLFNTKADTV